MIKLKEFKKLHYNWLSIDLSTGYDSDRYTFTKHHTNQLSIHIGPYYWLFELPEIIKPRLKWIDTTNAPWNTDKTGPQGYTEVIRKNYGVTFTEHDLQVHYGIQPGCWNRRDPENSDHTKVLQYPWNWEHVRWDAYFLDGKYLCSGEHQSQFKMQKKRDPDFKDWEDKAKRDVWFQTMFWFPYPKSEEYTKNYKYSHGKYDNWSDTSVDPKAIYQFYEYRDKYDNSTTIACVNVEEREWVRGRWKWLRSILQYFPGCVMTKRSLNVEFRDEVGSKKSSWKGGCIGCSEEMLPGESVEDCWKRFCKERTFNR